MVGAGLGTRPQVLPPTIKEKKEIKLSGDPRCRLGTIPGQYRSFLFIVCLKESLTPNWPASCLASYVVGLQE